MAFDDRPKLPRATLRDEKLYIEGDARPYFRDPKHTFWLRVSALWIHRGYQPENYSKRTDNNSLTESVHGVARFEEKDRFAVIGLN